MLKVEIFNGNPQGFKWYTGYDNKYNDKKEELKDTFSIKRIASLFRKG